MNYSKKKKMLTLSHPNYWIFSLYPVFDIENHISINIFMDRHLMWINFHDWDVWAKKYECLLVLSQSTVVTNMSPQTFYLCPLQYWKMYSYSWALQGLGVLTICLENVCVKPDTYFGWFPIFWKIPHIWMGNHWMLKINIWSKWISLWG